MVQKKVIWLVLMSIGCQAAAPVENPAPLLLEWRGSQAAGCRHLVEAFLDELRSMAADRIIQLEVKANQSPRQPAAHSVEASAEKHLTLSCPTNENPPSSLEVSNGESILSMRYSQKAHGFAATDWLPFQKKFLRPASSEISLAPVSAPPIESELTLPVSVTKAPDSGSGSGTPLLKRWWFWALIGGASASVFALTRSNHHDSGSINVEIH